MRTVRITLFLAMLLSLSLHAMAQEKLITLSFRNEPMSTVLKDIGVAGGKKINFNHEDVFLYKVSAEIKSQTVSEALTRVLAGTPLLFSVKGRFITVYLDPKSPEAHGKRELCLITGRVLDSSKNPLPGSTIRVKDTPNAAITDENGEFSLVVSGNEPSCVLQASFIGMETVEKRVKVVKGKTVEVQPLVMYDDLNSIDEVVVTGYQNISKARSTGAVTQVKMDDIMQPGLPSVDQMLAGRIPGLMSMQTSGEATATPKIRIRGTSSISGNKAPLWVLDGIILSEDVTVDHTQLNGDDAAYLIGNAIAGVNPQDIESITVLKDASATALYGVQAANGVIVVTTKKGKVGRPQFRYNGSVSVSKRLGYGDLDLMNAAERIELSKTLIENGYRYAWTPYSFGYEGAYLNYMNGDTTYDEFVNEVQNMADRNTDWYDLLFRNSVSHNHTVSLSGGTEQTTYYGSLGYSDTQSTGRSSGSRRYNFNAKINSWLKPGKLYLGLSLKAYNTKSTGYSTMAGVNPNNYAYTTSRTVPAYNSDGSYYMYPTRFGLNSGWSTSISGVDSDKKYSILNELANTGMGSDINSYTASLDFHWKITRDLTYELFGSYDKSTTKTTDWAKDASTYVSDIRGYMKGDVEKGSSFEDLSPLPYGGIYSQSNREVYTAIFRNTLRYNQVFAKHHTIGLMGVSEIRTIKTTGLSAKYAGWYPERGNTFNPVKTDAYLASDLLTVPTMTGYRQNYVSWLGNLLYSYKDKFTFSGNIRMDGSNQFGSNPEYRFLPCWSVAAKYTLTNEKFLKNQDILNYLAIRASYGVQGNVDSGTSPDLVVQVGALNETTKMEESYFKYLPNADLRWEKTTSYNIGLDFELFNDFINGTVDVYKKHGVDMIMAAKVSQAVGQNSIKMNYGKLDNSGVDLGLRITPYRSKNWEAQVQLNYSYVKNKLVKANPDVSYSLSEMASGSALLEGEAVGLLFSYPFAGLDHDTGYPLFYNKEGKTESVTDDGKTIKNYTLYTDEVEMVKSGVTTPPHSGGFTLSGRYKDLRLSASFSYSWGAVGRLPSIYDSESSTAFMPITNVTKEYMNRWYQPGDEAKTNIPKLFNYNEYTSLISGKYATNGSLISVQTLYNYSTARVAPTDVLRLSSMTLSYYFHMPSLKKFGISDMQLSLTGTNLCFWADKAWHGRDPESGSANVPVQPTYTLNLNINF